ncbi:Leishmanolysin-like peptidase 2 [Plecturocebus cupreus]
MLQEGHIDTVSLCCPGWSVVVPSQLTAALTSEAQRKANFLIQSTPPRTPVAKHKLALVAAAGKPSVPKCPHLLEPGLFTD